MMARRLGTNTRQGKRQGRAAKQPDPPSWECNAGTTKIKTQEDKANRMLAYVSSTLSMATHNLVNMVASTAVAGTVLLALLAARRFETGIFT